MAVKAVAMIQDFNYDGNDLYFEVKVEGQEAAQSATETFGAYDPSATDVEINSALRDDIRGFTESEWSLSYGQFDKVRLIHLVSILG